MTASSLAPAKVQRATLEDVREYVRILYHGEPGSGKTTAAAHMAKLGKVVFITAEPGLKAGPLRRLGVPVENIELHQEISFDAIDALYHELYGTLTADSDAYAGVVFDSFSELQSKILEQTAAGKFLVSQQDYGINTQQMLLLLRHFCDLPCHTVFVTHTKRDEDNDGETIYRPSVTPKLSGSLLGYVDLVCVTQAIPNLDGEEPDYIGAFRSAGKYKAKDRFGALPPRLINPTFDRVASYIDGTFRREAQREADAGTDVPTGLDAEQYEYRQRLRAANEAKEKAA